MRAAAFIVRHRNQTARRLAVGLVALAIGVAVVAHHSMPEMAGMAAGAVCVAVLAVGVARAVATIVRRLEWPTWVVVKAPTSVVLAPRPAIQARAGPLYLLLLVLRN